MIAVHWMIFWMIPIRGNINLYGTKNPYCDVEDKEHFPYGCKNFHDNKYLIIFYFLFCFYFALSAMQLRYGLPTYKKPSSMMQAMDSESYEALGCMISSQIFMLIPFAAELRCLLDFSFTRTSLDIFQFWQLFMYHMEIFLAHYGNQSYVDKIMGVPILFIDYIIGLVIMLLLLVALMGPIYFFSEFSKFSVNNPVKESSI